MLAEGADAAAMSRSIPMAKAMDDAMLALFQNGERLRPENGYPVRLFLPGWEGNMSVKWLRRLKVVPAPIMTKDETSRYTDLQADGKSLMFTYPMEVKSVITQPSHGMTLSGAGLHQITGIAWSGSGTIRKVEVSTDGGRTWTKAPLSAPVLPERSRGSVCPGSGTAARRAQVSRDRRYRRRSTRARPVRRRAWQQRHLPLQRHPGLERGGRRRGEACLRVTWSASRSRSWRPDARARPDGGSGPEPRARGDAGRDLGVGHQRGAPTASDSRRARHGGDGATVYEQKCQACHGARGAGQPNDRLVGGQGTLASKTPVRTIGSYWPYATTVFDYVRRSMPYIQPQSLTTTRCTRSPRTAQPQRDHQRER